MMRKSLDWRKKEEGKRENDRQVMKDPKECRKEKKEKERQNGK